LLSQSVVTGKKEREREREREKKKRKKEKTFLVFFTLSVLREKASSRPINIASVTDGIVLVH
jgi:hypothetical protein